MRHTKGPWKIHSDGIIPKYARYITGPRGEVICRVQELREEKHNALLIAAAPRLYDWMKRMAPSWDDEVMKIMQEIEGG